MTHARSGAERQGAPVVVRLFDKAIVEHCLVLVKEGVVMPSVLKVDPAGGGLRFQLLPEQNVPEQSAVIVNGTEEINQVWPERPDGGS